MREKITVDKITAMFARIMPYTLITCGAAFTIFILSEPSIWKDVSRHVFNISLPIGIMGIVCHYAKKAMKEETKKE